MKSFLGNYSYSIIKMFVNQFAISIFGAVLAMATASANNDTLSVVVSVFATLFYLFLIYSMTWEIGAKDKISVDVGKKEYRPLTGFYMSLFANIPNLLIALVYLVAYPSMGSAAWAGGMAACSRVAAIILQGMYLGLTTSITIMGEQLNQMWWTYFVVILPSVVVSTVAYFLGHKNFRFLAFLTQKDN